MTLFKDYRSNFFTLWLSLNVGLATFIVRTSRNGGSYFLYTLQIIFLSVSFVKCIFSVSFMFKEFCMRDSMKALRSEDIGFDWKSRTRKEDKINPSFSSSNMNLMKRSNQESSVSKDDIELEIQDDQTPIDSEPSPGPSDFLSA